MALTFGFYNSVEGDRVYDAVQFGQIFDGIITDGVYATYLKAMVVKASENAGEVIIQPGRAWFNHTWSYNDADLVMQAPAPEVLLDRIDALVLDINEEQNVRTNSFVWVQGTPASVNPERPTLIHTTTHNQYPLCYIRRHAETTTIYTEDITNMVGTSECPFVTGVLEGVDVDIWLAQWDAEFHTWENGKQADFEAWFQNIRDQLDEDAAGHLQNEIDDINDELVLVNSNIQFIQTKNNEQDTAISGLTTRMATAESGINSHSSSISELDNRTHVANASINCNFYFDYQGGKFGFNTDAARGAGTFRPFRGIPDIISFNLRADKAVDFTQNSAMVVPSSVIALFNSATITVSGSSNDAWATVNGQGYYAYGTHAIDISSHGDLTIGLHVGGDYGGSYANVLLTLYA